MSFSLSSQYVYDRSSPCIGCGKQPADGTVDINYSDSETSSTTYKNIPYCSECKQKHLRATIIGAIVIAVLAVGAVLLVNRLSIGHVDISEDLPACPYGVGIVGGLAGLALWIPRPQVSRGKVKAWLKENATQVGGFTFPE